ncbi:MAG: ATP-binding protein, partial [Bacteroidota bacterium]
LPLETAFPDIVLPINSDERRVAQILLNIINNAIKFTDKGFVRIAYETTEKTIVTKIIDTGIGIKKEDLRKLFKPFSQIDAGLTRNHEGTGLGLSICQKLVEKLGGTLSVESVPGTGSTFSVALPR